MKRLVCAAFAALLLISMAAAQNPPAPPKPAPELQRLKFFEGSWSITGTSAPGPWGPGGKFTVSEENAWGLGGFFLITKSTFKEGTGMTGNGVAYSGYDANKKKYTYDEFNSMGEAGHSIGTVNDKTWTWTKIEIGGQKINGRFTLTETSPTSHNMKYEFSTDGGATWNTAWEATGAKQGGGTSKTK